MHAFRKGWVPEAQTQALESLFERSFGYAVNPALWSWKYANSRGQNFGVWDGDQLIAHYGGMNRRAVMFGQACGVSQIGDVMVDPSHRGVGGRRGPFFQVMAGYTEAYCGFDKPHLLAYGFPTADHMRLGSLLKQYAPVDRIQEITWGATSAPSLSARLMSGQDLLKGREHVDALWDRMQQGMKGLVLNVRDAKYMLDRYVEHPTRRYELHWVQKGWLKRDVGLVVLQESGEDLELMDLVGDPNRFDELLLFARQEVQRRGLSRLKAWGTFQVTQALRGAVTPLDVWIPTCIWTPGPSPESLRDKWWLMLGDTDFR